MVEPPLSSPTPPPPPSGDGPPLAPLPWEDRERLGVVEALVETVKLLVTRPNEAFERAREQGDYFSPLAYALICGFVAAVAGALWNVLFNQAMLATLPPEMQEGMAMLGQMDDLRMIADFSAGVYLLAFPMEEHGLTMAILQPVAESPVGEAELAEFEAIEAQVDELLGFSDDPVAFGKAFKNMKAEMGG